MEKFIFVKKHIWKNLVYIFALVLQFFLTVIGYAVIKHQRPYRYTFFFVDAVFRPKILGTRLDILT